MDAPQHKDVPGEIAPADGLLDTPVMVPKSSVLLPIAAKVGRYEVRDCLGQGGMSTVYRASDPELQRDVALKVIRSDLPELDQSRLLREAQALARLSHPNVVQVLDVGVFQQRVFVAMELIDGGTLRDWWEECEPSERELLEVFELAGQGLAAAHAGGIVHRDFKPDNVMIDAAGSVRVMDFGIALPTGADDAHLITEEQSAFTPIPIPISTLTRAGAMVGTPAYMPPEQLEGSFVDARVDQFSFAVSLWEGITGQRPFHAATNIELVEAIEHGVRRPDEMSPRVFRALRRALAPHPGDRWPDMEAMLAALRQARRPRRLGRMVGWASLGVAVASVTATLTDSDPVCDDAEQAMEQVWSEQRRAQLFEGVAGSATPFASLTAARVEAQVDDYVERWGRTQSSTCEPSEPPAGVVACLTREVRELDALLTVLSDPSTDTATRAGDALASLPAPEACVEDPGAAGQFQVAGDEETEAVQNLRTRVAVERARYLAGGYEASMTASLELAELADELGDPPLRAQSWMLVGRNAAALGHRARAEQAYTEAYFAARGTDDVNVATAANALVTLLASRPDRHEEALRWAGHVRARLQTHPSKKLEADLEHALGWVALHSDGPDAALVHFERQLALLLELPETPLPQLSRAYFSVGEMHARSGRPGPSLEAQRKGLALSIEVRGQEHPATAASMVTLAIALHLDGQYDEALETSLRAIDIQRRVLPPMHRDLGRTVANHGILLSSRSECAAASPYFEEGREIIEHSMGPDDPSIGRLVVAQATCSYESGDYDLALRLYERARAIFEGNGHRGLALGRTLYNIGLCHRHRGQRPESERAFRAALEAMEGQPDPEGLVANIDKMLAEPEMAPAR